MKRVCVFCGASTGARPEYVHAARQLGRALVSRNLGLVYGGSTVGLMGEIANAVLGTGGEVVGVIYKRWVEQEAHPGLSELHIVDSLHERKRLMVELADSFIVLPGGIGTLDEFFEVLSWAQIGTHRKPCALLNTSQYYSKLIDFLDHAVSERFIRAHYRSMILVDENPEALLDKLKAYEDAS
jgi:uncharacterized protein (TIGR00730 family)